MTQLASYVLERIAEAPDRVLLLGNGSCTHKQWSARQLELAVRQFAAGLMDLGVGKGDHVGLVACNFDLWLVADLACLLIGAVDVPRAGDASVEEIAFVLGHSRCQWLIVEDNAQYARLLAAWPATIAEFRATIILKSQKEQAPPPALSFEEVCRRGAALPPSQLESRAATVDRDSLASIVYTSGTTGNPKGVMLSHGNFLHNVETLPGIVDFNSRDRYLSFLPTWHAFERTVEYCALVAGMSLHYSSKTALRKDLLRVKPTVVAGVPRLWESIAAGVLAKASKLKFPLKQIIAASLRCSAVYCAARRQLRGLELDDAHCRCSPSGAGRIGLQLRRIFCAPGHFIADGLIYKKLRDAVGGEIRFLVSGGGALPRHVDEFINRAGIILVNGYGLTETSPVVSLRRLERNVLESSGERLPKTRWRVLDDEGDNELPAGEKGALWIKGPQVMLGYYRNDAATALALRDGWFCSGDLAYLSDQDDVVICGRAKDTLVLRGGENVEPELIEAAIMESPYVRDVLICGHGQKHLAALILPEPVTLASVVPGLDADDTAAAADHRDVGSLLHRELKERLSAARGFRIFERVPKLTTLGRPFSEEDGTLTATFKKKRHRIEELYADDIQRMFEEGAPSCARARSTERRDRG
ncbi:MAG: AMP-binding protein [Planctomycetota bacterium]